MIDILVNCENSNLCCQNSSFGILANSSFGIDKLILLLFSRKLSADHTVMTYEDISHFKTLFVFYKFIPVLRTSSISWANKSSCTKTSNLNS